jgi:putative ABC transport system ATP-binding protein
MISFKNVSKSFILNNEEVEALSNINLQIKKGEMVVLKGISGSGKSTLISLMAALSKPSEGEIIVDNKEIAKLSDDFASVYRNTTIGLIFQRFNLFEDLSVFDNIVLPLYPKNLDKNILLQKANSLLQKFYLDGKSDVIVKKLSGGEQQRVAIVRALMSDAPIIIADEPTANLDKKLSLEFIEIMQQLQSMGKTIIIATHDPLFLELNFVDRYIELSNGQQI